MLIRDSGVDPALRRERAGGVRPDGASRRGSPSTRTCCCRCSSARTASRSRTRPSRSTLLADDDGRGASSATTRSRTRCSTSTQPDDAGAVRDARLLLRAAPAAGRPRSRPRSTVLAELGARVRAALGPRATARSRRTGSTDAEPRARCARLDRRHGQGRRRRAARRGRAGRPAARSARSGRSRRRRVASRAARTSTSVIVLDRADSPGGAPPLHAEVAAALYGQRRQRRAATSTGSAAATSIRRTSATSSPARRGAYVGLRGEPCPA